MGVAGLWDLIRPAAVRTSLHALGRDAFLANRNGLRAFTIGVDASIWIFHAQTTHAGSNPFLRTIFYRIAALLQHPVLPVFVFDGPRKPSLKRNRNVGGRFGVNDHYSTQFKQLLDVCGLEWWNAPGEAEAELALMNRQGKIDAVLSDDVDALLFGATCLLRNNSPTLSGAQASAMPNSSARSELRHYEMYQISDIVAEWTKEESALKNEEDCRMAMVLTALLSGGDYVPEGVCRMGPTIAMALAKAGCADFLGLYASSRAAFDRQVADVHGRIVEELKTNSSKYLGRRYKKNADDIAKLAPGEVFQNFPLDSYLCPATSPTDDVSKGWPGFGKGEPSSGRGKARNTGRGDLEGMARACERYFEWGTREIVCKKFASDSVNLFGAEIVAEARYCARPAVADTASTRPKLRPGESPERITSYFSQSATRRITTKAGTSSTHLVKIHSSRHSPLCPTLQSGCPLQNQSPLLEYRLEYRTETYIERCRAAMDGTRADPSTLSAQERAKLGMVAPTAPPTDTAVKDEIRIWIPEYLVTAAWPELVAAYDEEKAAKEAKKAAPKANGKKAATKKKTPSQSSGENADAFRGYFMKPPASQSAVREAERVEQQTMTVSASQPLPSPSPSAASSDLSPAPTPDPSSPDIVAIPPPSPAPTSPATPSKRSRPRRGHTSSSSVSSESAAEVVPTPSRHRSPRKRTTPERQPTAASVTGLSVDDAICISSDEDTPRPLRLSFAANKEPTPTPTRVSATKTAAPNKARRSGVAATTTTTTTATTASKSQAPAASTRLDPPRSRDIVTPAPPALPTPPHTRQRDARRRPASATPTPPEPAAAAQQPEQSSTRPAAAPRVTTSQTGQTRLDSMIVARPRKATAAVKPKPISTSDSLPKPRTPYFVVSEDEDGVEHVDLTKPRPRRDKAAVTS